MQALRDLNSTILRCIGGSRGETKEKLENHNTNNEKDTKRKGTKGGRGHADRNDKKRKRMVDRIVRHIPQDSYKRQQGTEWWDHLGQVGMISS